MSLWKNLFKKQRWHYLPAQIESSRFENMPFRHSFSNLVRMFDLRMWYIQNSPNSKLALPKVHELELLHTELNYQHSRSRPFTALTSSHQCYSFG